MKLTLALTFAMLLSENGYELCDHGNHDRAAAFHHEPTDVSLRLHNTVCLFKNTCPIFLICWASSSEVWLLHISLPVNAAFYFFLYAFVSEPSFHAPYTQISRWWNLQLNLGFHASLFPCSGREYFCSSLLYKRPEIHPEPINVLYIYLWQEGFKYF